MDHGVILARVSTQRQARPHLKSLKEQIKICRDYCRNNSILVMDVVRFSGSAFSSKSLYFNYLYNKLMEIKEEFNNKFILYVYNISRFCRNIREGSDLLWRLFEQGIRVYSVSERVYLNSEDGLIGIRSATDFSTRLSSQTKRYHSRSRYLGTPIGRPPYGYLSEVKFQWEPKLSKTIRKRIHRPVPSEQEIIKFILILSKGINSLTRLDHKKYPIFKLNNINSNLKDIQIVNLLNKLGYRRRDGKRWRYGNIRYLRLKNSR